MKIALDHLGWLGPDVRRLVDVFEALGFRVLGPVPLHSGATTGPAVQWSAHVMFRDTYLELTSVSAAAADNPLQRWRASPAGVRLVVLRTSDAAASHATLAAAGWQVTGVQHAQRRLAYGKQGVARFRWFGLRDEPLPGVLAAWVQHLDREALFDASVSAQPNTVHGIEALHHGAGRWPDALAEEIAGNVELHRDDAGHPDGSAVTGVDFVAHDLDACARAMSAAGVPFRRQREYLQVSADDAAGTLLRFREAAPAAPSARPPAGDSTGPGD
jgi:hypothetical protein